MNEETEHDLEHGYVCPCGTYHVFSVWVYAHLDIQIVHTCSNCDARNVLFNKVILRTDFPDDD